MESSSEKKFVSVEEVQKLPQVTAGILVANTELFTNLSHTTQEKIEESLRSFVSEKEPLEKIKKYVNSYRWQVEPNTQEVQSNAAVVEWEDGSFSIVVGDTINDFTHEKEPNTNVYVEIGENVDSYYKLIGAVSERISRPTGYDLANS